MHPSASTVSPSGSPAPRSIRRRFAASTIVPAAGRSRRPRAPCARIDVVERAAIGAPAEPVGDRDLRQHARARPGGESVEAPSGSASARSIVPAQKRPARRRPRRSCACGRHRPRPARASGSWPSPSTTARPSRNASTWPPPPAERPRLPAGRPRRPVEQRGIEAVHRPGHDVDPDERLARTSQCGPRRARARVEHELGAATGTLHAPAVCGLAWRRGGSRGPQLSR